MKMESAVPIRKERLIKPQRCFQVLTNLVNMLNAIKVHGNSPLSSLNHNHGECDLRLEVILFNNVRYQGVISG